MEPAVEIFVIAFAVAVTERPLDNPSGRSVVAGHGQPDCRAVVQRELALDKPFAERPATDQQPPVPVLKGSRHDLAGRGRRFVDQYDHLAFERPVARGDDPVGRDLHAFGRDDHRALRQEVVAHPDRLIHQAASVASQVEDQRIDRAHFVDGLGEFFERVVREPVHAYVAGRRVDLVGRIDRIDRDIVADDREVERLFHAAPDDSRFRFGSFRTPQDFRHVDSFGSHDILAVHLDDPVVRQQPHFLGRASRYDVHDDNRIVQYVELDAYPAETSVERLVYLNHFLGRYVGRVRVQLQKHFADRVLDQLPVVNGIDIGHVQIAVEVVELLQVPLRVVRRLGLRGAERGQRERCEQEQVMSDCFHYSMRLISSSKATACCSPVAMFLTVARPEASSSLPTITTHGTARRLAYSICFFIFALSG